MRNIVRSSSAALAKMSRVPAQPATRLAAARDIDPSEPLGTNRDGGKKGRTGDNATGFPHRAGWGSPGHRRWPSQEAFLASKHGLRCTPYRVAEVLLLGYSGTSNSSYHSDDDCPGSAVGQL